MRRASDVGQSARSSSQNGLRDQPPNIRMHLTGYSGLLPLPPAGDAGRCASRRDRLEDAPISADYDNVAGEMTR